MKIHQTLNVLLSPEQMHFILSKFTV